ncbi:hypothetical protein V5E97_02335 [Singulisphaera sp. Ch08]|uniref:Galactose oxidase n=1 Tax=Singulisphaera sp. Ch08 TaxID=3120278 RepID=A0AAU7CHN2_9BACT
MTGVYRGLFLSLPLLLWGHGAGAQSELSHLKRSDAPHVDATPRSSVADTPALALALESQPGPQPRRDTLKTSQPDRVEYEWVPMTMDAKFRPRDGAGALTFRGRMWLLGGWNSQDLVNFPRHCINEVHSSRDGIEWTLIKPNTFISGHSLFKPNENWEGRHTAGYVVLNDKMWIIGGDVNQGHYHYDVWNSEDGKRWNLVNKETPVPWGPRALHHTVAHNGKIWILGGQTVPQFAWWKEEFYRDIWNTDDGIHWNKVEPKEPFWPQRGMIGGSAVFRGRIWVLGGGTYDTPARPQRLYYNDVWSSEDGISWTQHTASAPWAPRQYHDVAVFDDRLWVLEGFNEKGGNRKDVWYSEDGSQWTEVPNTPWAPRHAASVFVHDGSLWMVAGNNMQADVWRLKRKTP